MIDVGVNRTYTLPEFINEQVDRIQEYMHKHQSMRPWTQLLIGERTHTFCLNNECLTKYLKINDCTR